MSETELPLRDQIAVWRAKAVAGTLTDEETAKAIAIMRQGRVSASVASAKSKAKGAPIDSDSLLDSL